MSYRMIVTNDRADKRHDNRFGRPLTLIIEGIAVETLDWGFGGFRSAPLPGIALDDEFLISHILDGRGDAVPVFATAKVVRRDLETGDIGVAFVHLGERAFALLEQAMFRRRTPPPGLALAGHAAIA